MRKSKKKLNGATDIIGKVKPSELSIIVIRQFAQCLHIEKKLHIPDNKFFIN